MDKLMLAMSGGVDSSTALISLKDKYEVIGVTLKLFESDDEERVGSCCSLSDIEDARLVASKFNIPHYVFNFKKEFNDEVIKRFVTEYIEGRTPNPCIDCNKYIKFSAMLSRSIEMGCKYFSTGHYARIEYSKDKNRWLLKKAISGGKVNPKDQSYVLYNLTQEQLSRIIFPLGEMSKEEVRVFASEYGLLNSKKPDSQDICFIPDKNYGAFIKKYKEASIDEGNFINKDGKVLGKHKGVINYTVGQRRGLGISGGVPLYVIAKDADANTVTVGERNDLKKNTLIADKLNWISIGGLDNEIRVTAKTRYSQTEEPATVFPIDKDKVKVIFDTPQTAITPGQRVVFYDNDIVVGGGVIVE